MSEWQPARLIQVHAREDVLERYYAHVVDARKWSGLREAVVRIREVELTDTEWRKAAGCDSQRSFIVHPDDCGCEDAHVCEHEILTD